MSHPINIAVDFSSPTHFGHCDAEISFRTQAGTPLGKISVDRRQLMVALEGRSSSVSSLDNTTNLPGRIVMQ